ncbi:MAG: hypothetical protein P1V81_13115 [Planctomycetota bacterium]|nr:hypothetical protein [Planctomycetota bacterium]
MMNLSIKHLLLAGLLLSAPLLGTSYAQDHGAPKRDEAPVAAPVKKAPVFAGEPYLLSLDVVTGEALGPLAEQVVVQHEGRELRFSSDESLKTFQAQPAPFLKRIDALMIADQLPLYPLRTCMVSGEELGEMGDSIDRLHKNRLVRLCCKMCITKFEKDPDSYIAELDKAVLEAQSKDYPLTTCPVSKEELGSMGRPLDRVVGGRLIRLCCKGCIKKLAADPARFVATVDAARAKAAKAAKASKEQGDAAEHEGHH